MLLKYFAIFAVCFALLAFGFSRWKKKYGYTNRPFKAGDKRPQTANFDIGRAIDWEGRRGNSPLSGTADISYTFGYQDEEGNYIGTRITIPPQ